MYVLIGFACSGNFQVWYLFVLDFNTWFDFRYGHKATKIYLQVITKK